MKEAQDVRSGEMIEFRGEHYFVLSAVTDLRHATTIMTCLSSNNDDNRVFVLRLFRPFKVKVISTCNANVVTLENTEEECRGAYKS